MPRKALVKIRAISDSKDTCRYEQIRGKFRVLCVRPPHADALRNFAPLREKYLHTESTEIHRICFACFCESLRRLRETITLRSAFCVFRVFCVRPPHADALRNFAPLREKYLHTESTEIHRICSACFCESLRRLRETITLRSVCVFRVFCVRPYPLRKALV